MSYNEKSDIWSLGCLLYELCALHPPFLAMDQRSLAVKIRDGRFKPIPTHYSEELGEFIRWMLQVNVSIPMQITKKHYQQETMKPYLRALLF